MRPVAALFLFIILGILTQAKAGELNNCGNKGTFRYLFNNQGVCTLSPWSELPKDIQDVLRGPFNTIQKKEHWHDGDYEAWKAGLYRGLENSYAKFYFNEVMDYEARNRFLAIFSKLKSERLWRYVDKITWVGGTIVFVFQPTVSENRFKRILRSKGYGDYWGAGRNSRWGYRSRFEGAQLHFISGDNYGDSVHVHLDINNPGDDIGQSDSDHWFWEIPGAIEHYIYDEEFRSGYCGLDALATLCAQGERVYFVTN